MGDGKSKKRCAICTSFCSAERGGDEIVEAFFSEFESESRKGLSGIGKWEKGKLGEKWTICAKCLPSVQSVLDRKGTVDKVEVKVGKLQRQILNELNVLWGNVQGLQREMEVVKGMMEGRRKTAGLTNEEKEMIVKFREAVDSVLSNLHNFQSETSVKLLHKRATPVPRKAPPRKVSSKKKVASPPKSSPPPPPVSDFELLEQAIKLEKGEPPPDDSFDDQFHPIDDFHIQHSMDTSDADFNQNTAMDVDANDSDRDWNDDNSDSDDNGDSSDEDFVPEEKPPPKLPQKRGPRGPYKKQGKPDPSLSTKLITHPDLKHPLPESMPTFRRNLIISIWNADSISTSFNLPSSPTDPRRPHALEYNHLTDTIHLGSIEITTLPTKKRLQCTLCRKTFVAAYKYQQKAHDVIFEHILSEHLKAYKCHLCDFSAKIFRKLKKHISQKHEAPPVPCDICGRPTKSGSLKTHKWTHLSSSEKEDPSNKHLLPHRFKNPELYESRRFACKICGKPFKRKALLDYHEDMHKAPEERERIMCTDCGVVVLKTSFKSHKKSYCNQTVKGVPCPVCQTIVKNTRVLWVHLRQVHPEERAFPCEQCGARFKTKPELRNHRQTHSEVRTHICQVCGTGFKQRKNLTRHEKGCVGRIRGGARGEGELPRKIEFVGHYV